MKSEWMPLFWEPVAGTNERLMAGVVLNFNDQWTVHRILRDDVLESLYGKAASNPKQLIEDGLKLCLSVVKEAGLQTLFAMDASIMGLHPGPKYSTEAFSVSDAIKQAAFLHSSLARIDDWDELDAPDSPASEEVSKRFVTEVREFVIAQRPELTKNFNRTAKLLEDGVPVKFGYLSETAVLHFSVLHPVRQAASVRDARARLWELSRAKAWGGLEKAALITAIPRSDEITLGAKQLEALRINRIEIEREADAVNMRVYPVTSVDAAAACVLEVVG